MGDAPLEASQAPSYPGAVYIKQLFYNDGDAIRDLADIFLSIRGEVAAEADIRKAAVYFEEGRARAEEVRIATLVATETAAREAAEAAGKKKRASTISARLQGAQSALLVEVARASAAEAGSSH